MIPVILSGGSGTRLWPLSRGAYPKQFLPLVTDKTMVQETVLRLDGIENLQPPIAVCNENHRFIMAEQLREIDVQPKAIILEPTGKNTAPAVTLAALTVKNPDAILLVLPADHVIENIPTFQQAVIKASQLAKQDYLVTFGIVPTTVETGYGYIKRSTEHISDAFKVAEFVEKPSTETAKVYVDSGQYYWNSGIFAFKVGRYLEEMEKFSPQILAACRLSLTDAHADVDFVRLNKDEFFQCPANSIDYALMEKTDKAVVIPLDAEWSDVGSWSTLWEVHEKDTFGNALKGDVIALDTRGSFIYSENKLVAAIGVEDMIIIDTDDAVMIAPKNKAQEVKNIVALLKNKQRREADLHRKVYRPWGYYDSVDSGERHKTKRIVVKPGAKLSVQKHHHRAEHWVVVKGTAIVSKGEETMLLVENESTFIPLGVVHSLENPGVIPLEMIEVQSGSYLGEDDIIRFADKYGRT